LRIADSDRKRNKTAYRRAEDGTSRGKLKKTMGQNDDETARNEKHFGNQQVRGKGVKTKRKRREERVTNETETLGRAKQRIEAYKGRKTTSVCDKGGGHKETNKETVARLSQKKGKE